jgi:nucleoside-diphosphate-sugar epimerase
MTDPLLDEIRTLTEIQNVDFGGKDVLVTGASGIIGNYLQTYLSCLSVNRRPKSITLISKSGEFSFPIAPNVKIEKIDLTSREDLRKLNSFDSIFHAAGYGQPGKFLVDPFKTIGLNTWVTELLIEKTNPSGDFIFFSSSEVYSGNPKFTYNEFDIGTTTTTHPRAPYIEGKRTGETLTHIAGSTMDINSKSLRIALIYGPGAKSDDQRVLYSFIRQALQSKQIAMKDPGQAIRTYGYVLNAISQILAVTFFGEKGIYNIGGDSRITILELAHLVASITNASVIVPEELGAFLKEAPSNVELDLSKVLNLGHQIPFVSMRDGLSTTINWMKS